MTVALSALHISTDELIERDRAHIIHPYLPSKVSERVVMVRGAGSRLWDSTGREYLDATGGLWLAQVGHGRQSLAEAAARQMQQLEYFTSFWEFSNERAVELATRLVEISPARLEQVYFTSGGSEGNEAAIKMARYYHHRRGQSERTWVLARRYAYHGIGYGSGTATGFSRYHDGFGPMLPNVRHLTPPWPFHREVYGGEDTTDFCVRELEQTIHEVGAERIAAFIGEPIMGVGGMIAPPPDYWPRIAEVLRAHGILLILDEVVTAYGRVGEWFAAQRYGVEPDIIITAKGITSGYIPLGAVLVSGEIAAVLRADSGFPMGYTYNGHPTACAVALANLAIIESENLLTAAKDTGAFLLRELGKLAELPIVGEVRGVGMMLAVELVADRASRRPLPVGAEPLPNVIRREHGVIVRDCVNDRGHSLVLSPPLVLTKDEARQIAAAIANALQRTGTDGTVR